jgi:hypothetical protein
MGGERRAIGDERDVSAEFDQRVVEFERFRSSIRNVDDRFAGVGAIRQELTELRAPAALLGVSGAASSGE